tara:strand:- start:54 stop:401 length:348 start_codon:yes stop_codon:yes gene_type:complete
MASAFISSAFCISYAPTDSSAKTITNPGRTFQITGISANNETGGGISVTVTDGTNNITQGGAKTAGANAMTWLELDQNHCDIASTTENLVITSNTDCKITVYCVAKSGGQSLTVS